MKKFFSLLLVLCACGISSNHSSVKTADIVTSAGSYQFRLEIADTPSERSLGLMNRTSLDDNAGMLFIWDENVLSSFWMKDTYISLDIIFIDENQTVVFVSANATPLSTDLITPDRPFRYVLEVGSGFVDSSGLAVGDRVVLNL